MSTKDFLKKYRAKRDFQKTKEPKGKTKGLSEKPIFVIQKHDARNLHYDFRIEIDGALKSWAVPKGPSQYSADKRLAVPTEDHPLEYAKFSGKIPEGEYGAGTVEIWDQGVFQNLRDVDLKESLKQGQIEISLSGKRLNGAYVLRRFQGKPKALWLLIKMKRKE